MCSSFCAFFRKHVETYGLRNGLLMLVELELEGQALGATLGLHDGFGMNLAEVEPIFQGRN